MPLTAQSEWIRPYHLSHFFQRDTLLDWLDIYGKDHGYMPDELDPETDMGLFLREKSSSFKAAVFRCLREKGLDCIDLSQWSDSTTLEEASLRTIQYMEAESEVIFRGTLIDEQNQIVCTPDFLVRSDVLSRFADEVPVVEGPVHYRIVDTRFGGLNFNADGETLGASGSMPSRKARLFLENRALGYAQGFEAPVAYLLGRTWSYTSRGVKHRGGGCFGKLAGVDMQDSALAEQVDEALSWVQRVRAEGSTWQIFPQPSTPELWPNSGNRSDSPWHMAKVEIAHRLEDPNLLWQVGKEKRDAAVANGLLTFSDKRATAGDFGITGAKQAPILDAFLQMIRRTDGCKVLPERVGTDRETWGEPAAVEFYVDFETVSNLDDDFSAMPDAGGQPLVFMIGCGHMEEGKWTFKVFTTDLLNEECEAEVIDAWFAHMKRCGHVSLPT